MMSFKKPKPRAVLVVSKLKLVGRVYLYDSLRQSHSVKFRAANCHWSEAIYYRLVNLILAFQYKINVDARHC